VRVSEGKDNQSSLQLRRHVMRNTFIIAIALAAPLAIAATPADARINERQDRQQLRIDKGIANGRLTARETANLERQQARIDAAEARDRADGGRLTLRERARIEGRQDRASANIYRKKHNRRGR
jgi:hypothetical protein